MKKIILNSTMLAVALAIIFTACKKKSSDPEPETMTTTTGSGTPASSGFTWTPSGGSAVVADSAFYYQQYNTIYAYKNGVANYLEINLTALSVASYSVSSSSGNALTYISGSNYISASSGQINLTASANNKISGNFSTPLSSGAVASVAGQFVDIPKK